MKLDLLKFFKIVEDESYCIIKSFELDYNQGSDIDIFCFDIQSFSKKIISIANEYLQYGYELKINNSRDLHWHIDIVKDKKIEIRFDIYGTIPYYKNINVKECLFSSIVENRLVKEIDEVKIYFQSFIDEMIIRYLEYIEYYKLRPDKVKHLDFILREIKKDEDNKKFFDRLHYYTKLPQILEPEKEYSRIDILKDIITKIKQTPINELPKKIIKKLKRG
jgi:hypothetical protein